MDNKVFNVNGESKEMLEKALDLAFSNWDAARGWTIMKDKGLVFLWPVDNDKKDEHAFPVNLNAKQCADMAWTWLNSKEFVEEGGRKVEKRKSQMFPMEGWDADADHDGSNELGWRVYCEDWGHVGNNHYAIIAVKPAYCWYGK